MGSRGIQVETKNVVYPAVNKMSSCLVMTTVCS